MSRKRRIFSAFAGLILLLAAAPAARAAVPRRAETALLGAVNAARRAHGLAPLRLDRTLDAAARFHTLDMLRRDYFSHADFAGRMARFRAVGPTIGENLAWESGGSSVHTVIAAWLASPEHRANLLRPGYRRVGIGLVEGSFLGHRASTVVTADFAGA